MEGKIVAITGASSVIGEATAHLPLNEGHTSPERGGGIVWKHWRNASKKVKVKQLLRKRTSRFSNHVYSAARSARGDKFHG
jgi:hypothetical protein